MNTQIDTADDGHNLGRIYFIKFADEAVLQDWNKGMAREHIL